MCAAGRVDVIIDATGNPNVGALVALETMRNGKHIVMLNVEADITIGRYLKEEARKAGVVYTGAAGDEPAAIVELISFAQSVGLEVIAAGKGKNNALQFDATPAQFEKEARERNMSARMLVEFVDGSKTMVEMTAVANATGLIPDKPGMHGPAADHRKPRAGAVRQGGRRHPQPDRRRRLHDRQGRRARRVLHRQAAPSARDGAHRRSQGRPRPLLRAGAARSTSPASKCRSAPSAPSNIASPISSRSTGRSPNAPRSPSATSRPARRSAASAPTIIAASR